MASVYVETDGSRVALRSERIVVRSPDDDETSVPLAEIDRLCVRERVQVTSQALGALFRASVPVAWLDWRGEILGHALPPGSADAAVRARQYARGADPTFALAVARRIVEAKIFNQLRLIQRLRAGRKLPAGEDLGALRSLLRRVPRCATMDELRGVEGAAAAAYFPMWAAFLPAEAPFGGRRAHPPKDAVNACLSFGSALLYHETVAAIQQGGLDPGMGLLHVPAPGRWALALDIMEPFRTPVSDSLALRLLSRRMLATENFLERAGGVWLDDRGKRVFLDQYEKRMTREFGSEHAKHRTTIRQQIRDTVQRFKAAIENPDAFRPFRLN